MGVQLAALSMRERPDPAAFVEAFTGTHRYVLDYLSEEVLERQPERVRSFLLQTSILQRLTASLCDAVTGNADSQEMLEDLERANLFLIPRTRTGAGTGSITRSPTGERRSPGNDANIPRMAGRPPKGLGRCY